MEAESDEEVSDEEVESEEESVLHFLFHFEVEVPVTSGVSMLPLTPWRNVSV